MSHNDVLIVDVFHVVFVWSGSRSSPYKKEMGLKTAASYLFIIINIIINVIIIITL